MNEYIAEYKAGETNDAYIVGHVDNNATEFEVPLLDSDGITRMYIVAYSGEQITDMVFDMIEVQRPCSWKSYGNVEIDTDMEWSIGSNRSDDIIESGVYPIEINENGTRFRIVNPFAENINSNTNYLYINAEQGLDKSYIESSYAPVTHQYFITAPDQTTNRIIRPYLMQDWMSQKIFEGLNTEEQTPDGLTFDLTNGYCTGITTFAREYNWQLYCEDAKFLYVNGCYVGDIALKLSDALVATPPSRALISLSAWMLII